MSASSTNKKQPSLYEQAVRSGEYPINWWTDDTGTYVDLGGLVLRATPPEIRRYRKLYPLWDEMERNIMIARRTDNHERE